MDTLANIFNDRIWFFVLEGFIALVWIRAIIFDIGAKLREGGTGAKITRGASSTNYFFTFLGLSVILIEIIISLNMISNHRVIIGLLNVGAMFYLCIVSVYFKNKIIGWISKFGKWSQQI